MSEQEAKDKWLEKTQDKYGGWCRLKFRSNTVEFFWEFGVPEKPNPWSLIMMSKRPLLDNFDIVTSEAIERIDEWVKDFKESQDLRIDR